MTSTRFGFGFCSLVGAVVIGAALVVAGCAPGPGRHEAVAWLQVRSEPEEDAAAAEAYRKKQIALLTSPFVVNAALRKPRIADLKTVRMHDDPATWLSGAIDVVSSDESEVIQVRLRGDDPIEIAMIVNAVTAAYLDDAVRKDRTERESRYDVLVTKFKEVMSELKQERDRSEALELAVKGGEGAEAGWLERDLEGFSTELTSVRVALRSVEADIAAATATGEPADAKLTARQNVLADQAVALNAEIERVRTKLRARQQVAAECEASRREVERLQRVADQLGLQVGSQAATINMPPRVRLLEEAPVPGPVGR